MMDDLIEFLHARLDEDEDAARNFDWIDTTKTPEPSPLQKSIGVTPGPPQTWELEPSPEYVTVYIDPARVLREVEAKGWIVHDYEARLCAIEQQPKKKYLERDAHVLLHPLKALAAIYSDHPDYREEWKP